MEIWFGICVNLPKLGVGHIVISLRYDDIRKNDDMAILGKNGDMAILGKNYDSVLGQKDDMAIFRQTNGDMAILGKLDDMATLNFHYLSSIL